MRFSNYKMNNSLYEKLDRISEGSTEVLIYLKDKEITPSKSMKVFYNNSIATLTKSMDELAELCVQSIVKPPDTTDVEAKDAKIAELEASVAVLKNENQSITDKNNELIDKLSKCVEEQLKLLKGG